MIPAYEGKEPYIFVSYAHKDSSVVFRLVEQLNERGYRIWYDEGIEPGSEWPEYIANHLLGAEMVLSVLTPSAVNSVNCRREINFALSKNKPVLTIYMEDIELPVGLELQLSSQQSVLYYTYDSEERFLDKIETCQHLRPCKRAAQLPLIPEVRFQRKLQMHLRRVEPLPGAWELPELLLLPAVLLVQGLLLPAPNLLLIRLL